MQFSPKYNHQNSYPFGMLSKTTNFQFGSFRSPEKHDSGLMPGRTYTSEAYSWGFNGKENDDEISGGGNNLDFGARIYDSRLGRWMSVDPLMKIFPDFSPYSFVGNCPLLFVDVDGKILVLSGDVKEFNKFKTIIEVKFANAVIIERNEKTNQVTMQFNEAVISKMAKDQNTTSDKIKEQLSANNGYKTLQTIMDHNGKTTSGYFASSQDEKDRTLIGKFAWEQALDMDDIVVLDEQAGSGGSFVAGIIHELWEAYDYQVVHNRYVDPETGVVPATLDNTTDIYMPSHKEAEKKQAEVMGVEKVEHSKDFFSITIEVTKKVGDKINKTSYTFNTDSHKPKNLESNE